MLEGMLLTAHPVVTKVRSELMAVLQLLKYCDDGAGAEAFGASSWNQLAEEIRPKAGLCGVCPGMLTTRCHACFESCRRIREYEGSRQRLWLLVSQLLQGLGWPRGPADCCSDRRLWPGTRDLHCTEMSNALAMVYPTTCGW
jgi:predicted nucleic acid-binding Zn ribbon protein